ncbi:MAG: hypothetical protein K0S25_1056, partial [Bacillus sp. (in: firmicutes)]|nr:hypothetical protein [Bacillus sp. (in: firmicutes)]
MRRKSITEYIKKKNVIGGNKMGVSSNNHGIHVFGEGVVSAEPDVLKITLGVFTDGIELQSAQTQNGIMITKVIKGVIEMGIN